MTFAQTLARQNRLRYRAKLLSERAMEVLDQPGQFLRALRVQERAGRALRNADKAFRNFTPTNSL